MNIKRICHYIILCFITGLTVLMADEFIVKSFTRVDNDLSARRYMKYDINGTACALIKVRTDISEIINFDSNMGVVHSERQNPGEYWVYVSPGERALKFMAEEFIPLTSSLEGQGEIKSLSVYEIQLTSKSRDVETLPVTILTDPEDAAKWVDGELLGTGENFLLSPGIHELCVKKEAFETYCKKINVDINHFLFRIPRLSRSESLPVRIKSKPKNAQVHLDDEHIGLTPAGLFLLPGDYDLMLSKKAYITFRTVISVRKEKENNFSFSLEKNSGRILFNITPPDAGLMIDNVMHDYSDSLDLSPGQHEIRIFCNGYRNETDVVRIEKGEILEKTFELERETGSLQISVNPIDALFVLETEAGIEKFRFRGMKYLRDIPSGNYKLKVMRQNYQPNMTEIAISDNKKSTVNIVLKKNDKEDDAGDSMPVVFEKKSSNHSLLQKEKKSAFKAGAELGVVTLGLTLGYELNERNLISIYGILRPVGAGGMLSYELQRQVSHKLRINAGLGIYAGYAFMEFPDIVIEEKFALGACFITGFSYSLEDILNLPLCAGIQYQPGYDLSGGWMGSAGDINLKISVEF